MCYTYKILQHVVTYVYVVLISLIHMLIGADWFSFADKNDTQQQQYDRYTFDILHNTAKTQSSNDTGIMIVTGHTYSYTDQHNSHQVWWSNNNNNSNNNVFNFTTYTQQQLNTINQQLGLSQNEQIKYGFTYNTVTIHTQVYLSYLLNQFTIKWW